MALAQGVRGTGAGLEVDGFLQQARDALHLELDCAGGDAPLISAAHGAIRPCGSVEDDATWDALLIRFAGAAFVLLLGWDRSYLGLIALATDRLARQHSFGPQRRKTLLHPQRIVVNRQGQEPDSMRIVNAPQSLLTIRANERAAWLAFV